MIASIALRSRIGIATNRCKSWDMKLFSSAQTQIENATRDDEKHKTEGSSFNYDKIRNEIIDYWMKAEATTTRGTTTKARYCCFTYHDVRREYLKTTAQWHWLDKELSSNIAGETGAVYIYLGAISAMNLRPSSKEALDFCKTHMTTEQSHLSIFEKIVPKGKRTKLIPLWKIAGFTLGFIPTVIGGSKALYVTVESVETFVEEHFQSQIKSLTAKDNEVYCPELVKALTHCCADEVHHKEDAKKHLLDNGKDSNLNSWWIKPWSWVVQTGSSVAAQLARRL